VNAFRADAVRCLARASGLDEARVSGLLELAEPERGEYALPCFTLAKERRMAPTKIAAEIAAAAGVEGRLAAVVAEGPYVNVRVDRARLAAETIQAVAAEGAAFGGSRDGEGRTVVIDYSSPNVAKPLAFHHLRTNVIGHSLVHIYRSGGWKVVGINHLGDWGTGFGKLLLAWELYGDDARLDTLEADELNALYVRINGEIADEKKAGGGDLEARARAWFKRLEDGDEAVRGRWRRFVETSEREFQGVYELLGISFEEIWGESFYEDKMPKVLALLREKGLLETSEGAEVVHLEEDGIPPCLIRKADGATLYATRDLAAAIHRHEVFDFDRALYVVDRGQALHFKQIRRVLEMAGFAWAKTIRHVPFGVIRMGGKKAKTREGSVVLLRDVFEEAVSKVRKLIGEKNPDLENAEQVARDVGIGAVVFSDLKNRRENDIDFDLDAIVAFDGKTGPYVMYSHARACSILRRANEALRPVAEIDPSLLAHDAEHRLVRLVSTLPDAVGLALERDEPSEVSRHLLDLCEAFHAYHTLGGRDRSLRVLSEDADLRAARLALTDAVRQALANGLHLLGMAAPTSM